MVFDRLSIRSKLIAPVVLLSLMLIASLATEIFSVLLPQLHEAGTRTAANQLTQRALAASQAESAERALTESYLATLTSGQKPPADSMQKIRARRQAGDKALDAALALMAKLPPDQALSAAADRVHQAMAAVKKARAAVDQSSNGQVKEKPWVWDDTATGLINSISDLRTAAFVPDTPLQRVTANNTRLQQSIWHATELMAQTRDILAYGTAQQLPLYDRQSTLHQNVQDLERELTLIQHNAPGLLAASTDPGAARQFQDTWKRIQAVVLGSYAKLTADMIDGAASGMYPLKKGPWEAKSDAALALVRKLNSIAQSAAAADSRTARDHALSLLWTSGGEILAAASLVLITVLVAIRISGRLGRTEQVMSAVESERDLTLRLDASGGDEVSRMGRAFNAMLERFQDIIGAVRSAANEVSAGADQVATASAQTEKGVQSQQDATHQVAAAMNEMAATVQEVAHNTADAATQADNATREAHEGQAVVSRTVESVRALAEQVETASQTILKLEGDSRDIGQVLKVITDISEQTNLLALNAAIEAARAGEHGRGFAVVAGEVRTLAARTRESTEAIEDIIRRLQQQSEKAVEAMETGRGMTESCVEQIGSAGEALGRIVSAAETITTMNTQIATAAEEQASVAEDIDRNITGITQAAEESTRAARETVTATDSIRGQMEKLTGLVKRFNIG